MAQTRAQSRIIRLVGLHALGGAGLGAAIALLLGGFVATFASVVAATAVMLIPEREGGRRNGGGRIQPIPVLVPVRAIAPERIRRRR